MASMSVPQTLSQDTSPRTSLQAPSRRESLTSHLSTLRLAIILILLVSLIFATLESYFIFYSECYYNNDNDILRVPIQ